MKVTLHVPPHYQLPHHRPGHTRALSASLQRWAERFVDKDVEWLAIMDGKGKTHWWGTDNEAEWVRNPFFVNLANKHMIHNHPGSIIKLTPFLNIVFRPPGLSSADIRVFLTNGAKSASVIVQSVNLLDTFISKKPMRFNYIQKVSLCSLLESIEKKLSDQMSRVLVNSNPFWPGYTDRLKRNASTKAGKAFNEQAPIIDCLFFRRTLARTQRPKLTRPPFA
jgi:hypothetical protein